MKIDLEIIDCFIEITNTLDNKSDKELIFIFHNVKEFYLSPTSSFNCFIDNIRRLLSKKKKLKSDITVFLNEFVTKKPSYKIPDNEPVTTFEEFQKLLLLTKSNFSSRCVHIIENFHKVKFNRNGILYAIKFFSMYFKEIVFYQITYLDNHVLDDYNFEYSPNSLIIEAKNKIFYPTLKLDDYSKCHFISKLIQNNLIDVKQSSLFEQLLLGINIIEKIRWLGEISTLFYFIKLMHKFNFFVDYSASKWKITSNLFIIEAGQVIEFKKLRGLKKSKKCLLIDFLFDELRIRNSTLTLH